MRVIGEENKKRCIITTSWDDGHPLDLRLVKLLSKYKIPATFYIPRQNKENPVLKTEEIKSIARDFEIGGHTLNHKVLTDIFDKEAIIEIKGCKEWLQELLGEETKSFSYPSGKFNAKHKKMVKDSGFTFARGVGLLNPFMKDQFEAPTVLQVYRHSLYDYLINSIKRGNVLNFVNYFLLQKLYKNNDLVGTTEILVEKIMEMGGTFHLWGHSWEIEKYGLWDVLEKILYAISAKNECDYRLNKELVNG